MAKVTLSSFILHSLLVISLLFMLFSIIFNDSFLLRWSYDGKISPETSHEVLQIRYLSIIMGFFIFFAWERFSKNRIKFDSFIDKKRNTILNIIVLIITLIILLIIAEVGLMFVLKDTTEGAGFGPGSLNFNEKYVLVNNEGMRDYNFSLNKTGAKRVIVIGDSFTFGAGVKNLSDIYSKVLERKINSSKEYEVYTFAVPGYNAKEEYEMLRDKAMKYDPDVIIIGFFLNDLENVDPVTKELSSGVNWRLPFIGYWLRDVSYTYYFLETKFNKAMENFGIKHRWIDDIDIAYRSDINRNFTKVVYKNISNLADETNASVIVVVFPMVTSHYEDYKNYSKFTIAHDFAKEVADENGFYYLDLLPYYSEYKSEDLVVNIYDAHPNELGHKIAGEKLYEVFFKNNNLTR